MTLTSLTLTDTPTRVSDVVFRMMNEEAVLVHPVQGVVRVLNRSGARLWELTDGRRTVGDLAAALVADYGVDPARAQADTLTFCSDLIRRGIMALAEN